MTGIKKSISFYGFLEFRVSGRGGALLECYMETFRIYEVVGFLMGSVYT